MKLMGAYHFYLSLRAERSNPKDGGDFYYWIAASPSAPRNDEKKTGLLRRLPSLRYGAAPRNDRAGYTLIEMAMAIAVLGMLTGMLMSMMTGQHEAEALKAEKKHLKLLDEALAYHVKLRGRLPCPANPALPETDANFGREDCTLATVAGASANEDIYFGMVPTRSLALADRHLYDAWGNRTGYVVIAPLTVDAASFNAYTTSEDTGVIHITDAAGNPTTQQLPDYVVAYSLISYGKDKKGGYNRVGAMTTACAAGSLDSANCDNADNTLVDAEIADTRFAATYYHDMLRWRDLAQLRAAVSTEESNTPQFVYITDSVNNRVQKFDKNGQFILAFGTVGAGDGQLSDPGGIAVDSAGHIWVADRGNTRVQEFDSDGNYVSKFSVAGGLDELAVDSTGKVYVTVPSTNQVKVFDNTGAPLLTFGGTGMTDTTFQRPEGIDIDSAGNIYVADTIRDIVRKFDSAGAYVSTVGIGTSGSGDGQFDAPAGVHIDASGNIWVADYGNNRVQKLDSSGTFAGKFGSVGSGDGQFTQPEDIAIDVNGNYWVVDLGNNRVQVISASNSFQFTFGSTGSTNAKFDTPEGIAIGTQ